MQAHFAIFSPRQIIILRVPIFLPQDSPEQLTFGLIICFITYGMYMMYAPFMNDGDDFLSQICQCHTGGRQAPPTAPASSRGHVAPHASEGAEAPTKLFFDQEKRQWVSRDGQLARFDPLLRGKVRKESLAHSARQSQQSLAFVRSSIPRTVQQLLDRTHAASNLP